MSPQQQAILSARPLVPLALRPQEVLPLLDRSLPFRFPIMIAPKRAIILRTDRIPLFAKGLSAYRPLPAVLFPAYLFFSGPQPVLINVEIFWLSDFPFYSSANFPAP